MQCARCITRSGYGGRTLPSGVMRGDAPFEFGQGNQRLHALERHLPSHLMFLACVLGFRIIQLARGLAALVALSAIITRERGFFGGFLVLGAGRIEFSR